MKTDIFLVLNLYNLGQLLVLKVYQNVPCEFQRSLGYDAYAKLLPGQELKNLRNKLPPESV